MKLENVVKMIKYLFAALLFLSLIFIGRSQCVMQGISTYTNPCVNGFYSVTVNVSYIHPPIAGELVITCCNGQSQTFYPPFQNSASYQFTDIVADGGSCVFTASFSAIPNCSITMNSVSTPICPCEMPLPFAAVSSCDNATNTFSVTGSLAFEYPPNTGTLTISDCHGNNLVLNPPFVSPVAFSFDNLDADGSIDCFISAVFSAQPSCEVGVFFDAPSPCNCTADVGTFSFSQSEHINSSNTYDLCYGEVLNIQSNLDFVPEEPNFSALAYNPTLAMLVYSCPPTVLSQNTLFNDPCFQEIWLPNNNAWTISNAVFGSGQIYLKPVMLYNQDNLINPTPGLLSPCFDLGELITVNLLPEIQIFSSANCMTGTASIEVSGSHPAFFGTSFYAENLQPQSANFGNNTALNNQVFVVNGLQNGDVYSFEILDEIGCSVAVTGQFQGPTFAQISYNNEVFCKNNELILPTIDGTQGGSFSSNTMNLALDVTTGEIDLANSNPGNYQISYHVGSSECFSISTFELLIGETYDQVTQVTVCDSDLPFEIGGFTFFESGVQGDHYSSVHGCDSIVSIEVFVAYLSEPNFTSDVVEGCSPLHVSFQNLSEGNINQCQWYFGDNSPILSGCTDMSHTYTHEGCFDVHLTTIDPNGCSKTTTHPNLICVTQTPTANFMVNQEELNAMYSTTYVINLSENATAYIWNFGDDSSLATEFEPNHTFPPIAGSYDITLTAINSSCIDSTTRRIDIENVPLYFVPNAFTPDGDLHNNEFKPILVSGIDLQNYSLLIYNRWGGLVFESRNAEIGWDGRFGGHEAQEGIYIWKLSLQSIDHAEPVEDHGFVSLLR